MTTDSLWQSIHKIIDEGFTPEGLRKLENYAEQFTSGSIVYQRFSPAEQYGCAQGGSQNVIASLLAGAENFSNFSNAEGLDDFKNLKQRAATQINIIRKP